MPAVLALPAFWAAVAGGTAATGAIIQSRAAGHAADVGAQAQREATAAQAKSTDEALSFQKEQAAKDQAIAETNRHADYDQWAAREGRLSTVGGMLGLPARQIPGYVPMTDTVSGMAPAPKGSTPTGGVPERPGSVEDAMQLANQTAYGFDKHTDPGYWQALWAKDPDYAFRRMLGEGAGGADVARKGPYAGAAGSGATSVQKTGVRPGSIASTAPSGVVTPAYVAPPVGPARRVVPGSIFDMTRNQRYGA